MLQKKLIFATNNRHKLREVAAMLGEDYTLYTLTDIGCTVDIPETSDSFAGNALQKARYVKENFGYDCFADDSGLEVDALNGEPGVHSARYSCIGENGEIPSILQLDCSEANMEKLICELKGKSSSAQFRTVTALIEGDKESFFEGIIRGTVITKKRGENGFGYDPLFIPEGYNETFAELAEEVKNKISHRARSIKKMCEYLTSSLSIWIILLMLLGFTSTTLKAENLAIGEWKSHLAYSNVTTSESAGKLLYVIASGALFSIDSEDESLTTYSKVEQLNDQDITHIIYNQNQKTLIIIYSDYNIDLLTEDGTAYNIPDYMNKTLSQTKTVNSLTSVGDYVYLNTAFGIVELNVKTRLITNTYILGKSVSSSVKADGICLAATKGGLFKGNLSDNLLDVENWMQINSNVYSQIAYFDNNIFLVKESDGLFTFSAETNLLTLKESGNYSKIRISGKHMLVTTGWNTIDYTSSTEKTKFKPEVYFSSISYMEGYYYISTYSGYILLKTKLNTDKSVIETQETMITPNGPIRNLADYMRVENGLLYVCGGGIFANRYSNPGTIMCYDGSEWINFEEDSISIKTGLKYNDITTIAIDPKDPNHIFASSAGEGLYEFKNNKFVKLYSKDNSTLIPVDSYGLNYVRINGLNYDSDGNLWMTNAESTNILNVLKSDGTWTSLYYSDISKTATPTRTLIDSENRIWVVCSRNTNGVFCANLNGTLEDTSDDKTHFRSAYTNQDGTIISGSSEALRTFSIAEDKNGQIWIGTAVGPLLVSNPSSWFNSNFTITQVKIPRNDGSGLADYMLSGERINDIAVDGGNRKWFATENSGVYLMSADGTEELLHFDTDNSPLPSNTISSIGILPTGEVFFGTSKGIVSYKSDATEASENFDSSNVHVFPNPVHPDYTGVITVTGLIYDADIKIVDAAGHLVNRGTSVGGSYSWDGKNTEGKRVASGVYLVLASDSEGSTGIATKIVVIR